MTPSLRTHLIIAPVALMVAGLGAANWYVSPQKAVAWLIAMGFMAFAWLVVIVIARARPNQTASERGLLVLSVVAAGLMLAAALGMSLGRAYGFESDLLKRGLGVAFGLVLMVLGNLTPKAVASLTATRCSPATGQSIQRFTGWTFVLAGIAYAGMWVVLAPDLAEVVATAVCGGAVVLVIGRIVWAYAGRRPQS